MDTLNYQTTSEIQAVIDNMGRTEDAKFSADGKYLAIIEFTDNKVHLFEIKIESDDGALEIHILSCITVTSDDFKLPHGVVFLGKSHFLVTNRGGDIVIFDFPTEFSGTSEIKLTPVSFVRGRRFYGKISSPGSVGCYQTKENTYRLLALNNYLNTIVAFDIHIADKIRIKNKGVVIKRDLNIPDGISVSPNQEWVAISNHYSGTIAIYRLTRFLNRFTKPSGTLINIAYPHGLRFSADGRKIFSTDAGSQYLHIYESDDEDWDGIRKPKQSIKLVDADTFAKVRINPEEGGLKGIDVAENDQLLVTTAEHQVLKFYAIKELLSMPTSSVEQYVVKEKMKYYRSLEKGVAPDPEIT